ncbi:hypothetical protein ACFLSX_02765 [Calditrichota bacterium]
MRKFRILIILMFLISGCYTLLDHPEIEVYYEREGQADSLAENYDVFVDEDCASCHDNFLIQKHFSPLIPAHNTEVNWDYLPWWFDTKYLTFISGNRPVDDSSSETYQHVQSQQRSFGESPPSGGYLPAASGGSATTSGASSSTKSTENSNDTENKRTSVNRQGNNTQSSSESVTTKRKFRKRK